MHPWHAWKTLYVSLCIFHCSKNQKKTFGYIFLDTFYMTLSTTTLERKCWWSTTSFCERWIDCANHNSGPVEATRIWVGKYYRCWSLRVFQSEWREIHWILNLGQKSKLYQTDCIPTFVAILCPGLSHCCWNDIVGWLWLQSPFSGVFYWLV